MSEKYTSEATLITLATTLSTLVEALRAKALFTDKEITQIVTTAQTVALNGSPEITEEIKSAFTSIFPFLETPKSDRSNTIQ